MLSSSTNHQPKPPPDELVIIPSETCFSREQWQAIKDGASKGASQGERLALKRTISTKFPAERHAKPGPKGSAPTDLARIQHQRFIWLIGDILGHPDDGLTETETLIRACTAIHNFNTFCESGVFLNRNDVQELARCRTRAKLDDSDECDFLTAVARSASTPSEMDWKTLQLPAATPARGRKAKSFRSASPTVLLREALPVLLGISDSEFRVFAAKRLRRSKAGRPKNGASRELRQAGWDGSERVIIPAPGLRTPEVPEQESRPGASEGEIFRKAVARLLLVKTLVTRRVPVELSASLWDRVLEFQREEWHPASTETQAACTVLWDAAQRQPIQPWDDYRPQETAGRFVEIPDLGMLEVEV